MINEKNVDSITEEYVKELDEVLEMQSLTHDIMLKNLFERNEYILKRFIISVLHLDIRPNECKLYYLDKELPVTNHKEYKKTLDFNVSINDSIFVNIELNRSAFQYVKQRNYLYHTKQISYSLKKGQAITELSRYTNIQLNLNAYDKSNNLGEDIIVPYSIKTNSIYIENDIIYLKYLDYYYKLYYNETIKKEESDYWLAMLMAKNFTELNNILSQFLPNDLREKIIKDVENLSMDEFVLEDIEREALDAIELRDSLYYAKEEGIEQGIEQGMEQGISQGVEQNKIETIKALLKKKISYQDIEEITGKSVEEIKKIEETMSF